MRICREGGETQASGRAKCQIAVALCPACKQGQQEARGVTAPMDDAAVERALCDAQHTGSLDTNQPTKPTQDIPAATRRYVWRRDRGCCSVPGCRSKRNLEIHHIVVREHGGSHAAENLLLLCDGHHTDLHEGVLSIRGKAPDLLTIERAGNARVFPDPRPRAPLCASSSVEQDAITALRTSGFRPHEAAAAVRAAAEAIGTAVPIEVFLREALKHCR